MRRLAVLAPVLMLALAPALVPFPARADAASDHAARTLAASGPGACLVQLDVTAVVRQETMEIRGVPFRLVTLRAAPISASRAPNNSEPAACTPTGAPPPADDLAVIFPAPDVAAPPEPPAVVEVVAEVVPGFVPYGIGGGIVLAYVRTTERSRTLERTR